jgi:beta-lactamase regulating signal transducer with metallopeptidase domain
MNADELPHLVAELLLKSALVILVGFTFVALIRRSAPEGKHRMWQCIFAAGLAIPLLLMFPRWEILPSWTVRQTPEAVAPDTERSISMMYTDDYRLVPPLGNQPASAPPPPPAPAKPFPLSALLLGLWATGVLALLIQSVAVRGFLRRLEQKARPPVPRLRLQFEQLRSDVGAERPVTLLISPEVRSPFAWGLARSRILLPESAERWSESDLEMVLLHELEHVRRGDARAVLIARLFLALNWINPLAWIAHRQSVRYREEACDEEVVRYGHDPQDYADLLLRQARTASASALFNCATSVVETGTVEGRVKRVLANGGDPSPAPTRLTLTRWVTLFAVISVVAIALLGWRSVKADDEAHKASERSSGSLKEEEVEAEKAIENKLQRLVISSINFDDTPLSEAIATLERKTAEVDSLGGGIRIQLSQKDYSKLAPTKLTVSLTDIPLSKALHLLTALAQCKYRVTNEGVEISSLLSSENLSTNIYRVPPSAFAAFPDVDHRTKMALEEIGMVFGKGSNALYNLETKTLIVRNTRDQLKRLEAHFPEEWDEKNGGQALGFLTPEEADEIIAAKEVIETKMEQTRLPAIEFTDTPFSDALAFLDRRSAELDPLGEGVRFRLTERDGSKQAETQITLRLSDVTLSEALRGMTKLSRSVHRVTENGVNIFPTTELDRLPPNSHGLYTNVYSVPSGILVLDTENPESAREILESMGITFGPGADAIYDSYLSRLTVRNNVDQMELVDAYLRSLRKNAVK